MPIWPQQATVPNNNLGIYPLTLLKFLGKLFVFIQPMFN